MTREGLGNTPDPEGQSFDPYIRYLDGLKNWRNKVIDFQFILALETKATFAEFVERIEHVGTETIYAGLHITDPNWYEDGQYNTGAIEPVLFGQLESHFRAQEILEDGQHLDPIVHYSQNPPLRGRNSRGKRPNMIISVSGGEREDWGQFITCWLDEHSSLLSQNDDPRLLEELKWLARNAGKQEKSFDQAMAEIEEQERIRRKLRKPDL